MYIYEHHTAAAHDDDEALLSPHERERAHQFATPALRQRYIASHAFVRRVLAVHTGAHAAALRFGVGEFGKPLLIDFPHLHFNLSHSKDWALCAVSEAGPVGIDIEAVRPLAESDDLAARFFSAAECAALTALPQELRLRAFFEIWTKKEAYVKATGRGLTQPLHAFSVPIGDDRETVLPERRWRVRTIDAPAGYAAAVCERDSTS